MHYQFSLECHFFLYMHYLYHQPQLITFFHTNWDFSESTNSKHEYTQPLNDNLCFKTHLCFIVKNWIFHIIYAKIYESYESLKVGDGRYKNIITLFTLPLHYNFCSKFCCLLSLDYPHFPGKVFIKECFSAIIMKRLQLRMKKTVSLKKEMKKRNNYWPKNRRSDIYRPKFYKKMSFAVNPAKIANLQISYERLLLDIFS